MKKNLLLFAIPILLVACAGNQKKVLILSHDNPQIDEANYTINCPATRGHEEKELVMSGNVTLKVNTAAGNADINLPDAGYYIVNLKNNDTIIGSYQLFTTADQAHRVMTQADLKQKIDSLEQLVQGKNVSAANRNYFILPNTAAKITPNIDATIIAPYHKMSGVPETAEGKAPEVYEFYTVNEVRETIANLRKLTVADSTAAH
ncbi:MAG TPA: hypothetical protein VHB48_07590 [Chitinophagaceae bacterium]|nr:hypothetical protein [Chitinophagaceae bacterium]